MIDAYSSYSDQVSRSNSASQPQDKPLFPRLYAACKVNFFLSGHSMQLVENGSHLVVAECLDRIARILVSSCPCTCKEVYVFVDTCSHSD